MSRVYFFSAVSLERAIYKSSVHDIHSKETALTSMLYVNAGQFCQCRSVEVKRVENGMSFGTDPLRINPHFAERNYHFDG